MALEMIDSLAVRGLHLRFSEIMEQSRQAEHPVRVCPLNDADRMLAHRVHMMGSILLTLHTAVELRKENGSQAGLPGIPDPLRMRGHQQFHQFRLNPFRTLQLTAGATESTLDLSSIMWIFYGYSGKHTLTFHMTDAKGQDAEASLTFTYTGGGAAEDPSIVCRQFDLDQPKVIAPGQEIDVDINTTTGITAFVVTITSETLNEETLGAVGLKPSFDLCNITDEAELAALTSETIGFPVNDEVKGKTSMTFSISKFVDMLIIFPGTHQFTLAITNEGGSTTTKTLTLIVEGE